MCDLLKVKFRIQIAETRIRHACQVCRSSCALIMLHLSLYARQGCQILLGAPKPKLSPSLTRAKSRKTATLIQISDGKPFFFKTRSPNLALLKLFLRRLSPQAGL
jgi:hypothetical protein